MLMSPPGVYLAQTLREHFSSTGETEALEFRQEVTIRPIVKNRRQIVDVDAVFIDLLFERHAVLIGRAGAGRMLSHCPEFQAIAP